MDRTGSETTQRSLSAQPSDLFSAKPSEAAQAQLRYLEINLTADRAAKRAVEEALNRLDPLLPLDGPRRPWLSWRDAALIAPGWVALVAGVVWMMWRGG